MKSESDLDLYVHRLENIRVELINFYSNIETYILTNEKWDKS